MNPPITARNIFPEKAIANANITHSKLIAPMYLYREGFTYSTAFAPTAAPSPMTKSAGPNSTFSIPICGSLACKKKRTSIDTAPIIALNKMMSLTLGLFLRKRRLSPATSLKRALTPASLLISVSASFKDAAIPIESIPTKTSTAYAFLYPRAIAAPARILASELVT